MMIDFAALLLGHFGLAYIVGHSKISLLWRAAGIIIGGPARWLVLLVECPACFGFWSGLVHGLSLGLGVLPSIGRGLVISSFNLIVSSFVLKG